MDPGLSGALALVGDSLRVFDVPTIGVGARKQHRKVFNRQEWREICAAVVKAAPVRVLTENVGGAPKQSNAAGVSFGKVIEGMEGGLWYAGIDVEHVAPVTWQRMFGLSGLDKEARKALSRQRACEIFPDHARLFARVCDHNRADAALIAEFNRRTYSLF